MLDLLFKSGCFKSHGCRKTSKTSDLLSHSMISSMNSHASMVVKVPDLNVINGLSPVGYNGPTVVKHSGRRSIDDRSSFCSTKQEQTWKAGTSNRIKRPILISMQITTAAMSGILLLATALLTPLTSVTVAAAEDHQEGVRGSQIPERIHPIKRIYGKENAHVRDAIHQIETESTQYFRTGIRADPSFEVDYANHPLRKRKNRELVTEDESAFKPMRISFVTDSLDSQRDAFNGAKIDFIKGEVINRMAKFWSETLSAIPVGTLKIQSGELIDSMYCGHPDFTRVPTEHISTGVADTDVILYVSASSNAIFCGATTLAVAVACNVDDFDRPTAGSINFCLDQIKLDSDGTAHESVIQDNVEVAIHEAAHVFGMSRNSLRYFWDSETGERRTERPFKPTTVECVTGTTQFLTLPDTDTLQILTAENGQRFATIVTPKVRTVARNQFNCQDLEGGQLENLPTSSSSCYGSHWDERLYYPELLSGIASPNEMFLSPLSKYPNFIFDCVSIHY